MRRIGEASAESFRGKGSERGERFATDQLHFLRSAGGEGAHQCAAPTHAALRVGELASLLPGLGRRRYCHLRCRRPVRRCGERRATDDGAHGTVLEVD